MNIAVRQKIADRLKKEISRKGFNLSMLSKDSLIPLETIESYLNGSREIKFDELRPVCESLSLRLMRLLAPEFVLPKLQFRGVRSQDRGVAAAIESTFLLVADLLPKPRKIPIPRFDDSCRDIQMLLAETSTLVEYLRKQFPTVETLYRAANLPILPIHAGQDCFDAFIMSTGGGHALVCVNIDKPPIRIHFSLLHEMAHFLLHLSNEIQVDRFSENLYSELIDDSCKPEYIANKFAQFYLIPFHEAEQKARNWKSIGDQTVFLSEHRTGPDVLASSIFDCLRLRDPKIRYVDVRDKVEKAVVPGYARETRAILDFIEDDRMIFMKQIYALRDKFSDDVWAEIVATWDVKYD